MLIKSWVINEQANREIEPAHGKISTLCGRNWTFSRCLMLATSYKIVALAFKKYSINMIQFGRWANMIEEQFIRIYTLFGKRSDITVFMVFMLFLCMFSYFHLKISKQQSTKALKSIEILS